MPQTTATPEQVTSEYNVYADSFIPSSYRAINMEEPGGISATPLRHKIDFSQYIATFCGTSLLPKQPELRHQKHGPAASKDCTLTAHTYFDYFHRKYHAERLAQEQENERFALYRVPLYQVSMGNNESLWALLVPGLREDNPVIEMGDILQLRQLWVDTAGNIMSVPMQVEEPPYGHIRFEHRSWTGIQHNASVSSMNRAQEVVYLKADSLSHLLMGPSCIPMMVNVTFPLKSRLHLALQRALLWTSSVLADSISQSQNLFSVHKTQNGDNAIKTQEADVHPSSNEWIRKMLFPNEEDGAMQIQLRSVPHRELFDSAINYEQAHAVGSVCTNDYSTLPYLISGPPGTGKTKTLVELAMQLLETTEIAHALICAPSEAAADTLAIRLSKYLSNKQLLRLNRPNRADNEVPRELNQYCFMEDDKFYLPPFQTLMGYNVVVTSCQDAAILAEARVTNMDLWEIERRLSLAIHPEDHEQLPALHWGALLIDEAAQATEIDVLPAITVICPPPAYPSTYLQPRLIMAGDDHQLGPRTACRDPEYSASLFARLFARPLYTNHPLSRSNKKPTSAPPVLKKSMLPIIYPPFTNLIRNYRSHPAILSVPSSLFYNDTLIPEALIPKSPLQHSSLWRGRKWPVLFIPHTGPDEIEREGGGWYNMTEARVACAIAETLIHESNVAQADICIMSPFAAQVKVLRAHIRSAQFNGGAGFWDVNIGPLEAFQGLERRVVILCTTRTRERFLERDGERGVGIVGQRRRMNVALTRAKEAMIVIGNPEVLGRDECWKVWLGFCWRNGLVHDVGGLWKGDDEEGLGEEKVGVLERALVAKENHGMKGRDKALGSGTAELSDGLEYDAWVESLREALEEEDEDEEEPECTEKSE